MKTWGWERGRAVPAGAPFFGGGQCGRRGLLNVPVGQRTPPRWRPRSRPVVRAAQRCFSLSERRLHLEQVEGDRGFCISAPRLTGRCRLAYTVFFSNSNALPVFGNWGMSCKMRKAFVPARLMGVPAKQAKLWIFSNCKIL